ncbi:hypothetical protein FRB90_007571, partial [Tulasnella sp. 427]
MSSPHLNQSQDSRIPPEDITKLKEVIEEPRAEISAGPTLSEKTNMSADSAIPPRTRDFGFIPIPERRRYHPERTFQFTLALNIIFGFASTATVANLYYCQPLLVKFAQYFQISEAAVSSIPTITQAGYATGLLLISPLGDLVRRRGLLLAVLTASTLVAMGIALSRNLVSVQVLSYFLGVSSVTPQILIPFAGDLAPPNRRGTAISIVLSGLLLGIIFGRAIGGVIGDASHSWKNVYWIAVGIQGVALAVLWWVLPDWPSKVEAIRTKEGANEQQRPTYLTILWTMAKLAVTEPILIQGCLINLMNQVVFSSFWVTLTFLLAGSPFHYSTYVLTLLVLAVSLTGYMGVSSLKIGLFGLVGALGVMTAPFVGRLIDGLVLWVGILIGVVFGLVSQIVLVVGAGLNIAPIIIGCIGLDFALQVAIATRIYEIDPALRARLNAVFVISGFTGQVIGSALGSHVYLSAGWRANYATSIGFCGAMLLILLARGPHCERNTWFGWQGGGRLKKEKPKPKGDEEQNGTQRTMSEYMSEGSDAEYYDEDDEVMNSDGAEETDEESVEEGDYGSMEMSVTALSKPQKKVYEIDYEVLSSSDIEKSMAKEADLLCGMLGVDITTSYQLLRFMNWNKEKLIDKFMEDPDAVKQKAGIADTPPKFTSPSAAPPPPPPVASSSSSSTPRRSTRSSNKTAAPPPPVVDETWSCPICCCEPELPTGVMSLECNHPFCTDCWQTYMTGKIREEGEHTIRCMESGCNELVPDTVILGTVPDAPKEGVVVLEDETKDKYKELLVRYFVQCNSALRFCPAPSCDYTVQCSAASTKSSLETIVPTVRCGRNHSFCFGCGEEGDHRPLICTIAKLWLKKCQDDSETANWIKTNTKECPKCHSTIEKNGGCNHMTCKKCKNEFCWVCMGPWSEHGNAWYSCNRFDEKEGVDARDAQSLSRASLERYLHYYNRWANHEQSAR